MGIQKRKVLTKIFVGLFIATCGITSVSAMHLKKEPVSIKVGSASASSDPTDYGMKAYYYFKTAADSKGGANVSCMAGWKGSMYPYTLEGSFIVKHSGGSGSTTVTQSKTSRFYIKVFSSVNSTKGNGYVQLK